MALHNTVRVVEIPTGRSRRLLQFEQFDHAYVERLAAGDPETERHFVAYFGELLGIKLRSRMRTPVAVEEVRQEVFMRIFRLLRKPDGVRQPERLGALVNSICDHVILEYRRAGTRHQLANEDAPERRDESASAESEMLSGECRSAVRHVLDQLPAREQFLLRSVYLEEQERDEVCRQYGVDREYLRVLLHRAKSLFKTRYLALQKSM